MGERGAPGGNNIRILVLVERLPVMSRKKKEKGGEKAKRVSGS